FTIGALRIDTGMRRLTRGERVIDVSAREFDILRLLAEAAERVVERQQLFASVWGPAFYGDERALDVYIRMIRKKIEPDPSDPLARGDIAAVDEYVVRAETLTHARLLIVDPGGNAVAVTRGWTPTGDDSLGEALDGRTSVNTDPSAQVFGGAEVVRVNVPLA